MEEDGQAYLIEGERDGGVRLLIHDECYDLISNLVTYMVDEHLKALIEKNLTSTTTPLIRPASYRPEKAEQRISL